MGYRSEVARSSVAGGVALTSSKGGSRWFDRSTLSRWALYLVALRQSTSRLDHAGRLREPLRGCAARAKPTAFAKQSVQSLSLRRRFGSLDQSRCSGFRADHFITCDDG